jgi:DNA-directed RNA polymerase subunit RPC12/RpoP
MRWLGRLPGLCFSGARVFLNLGSRAADRCFSTNVSRYGWALAFAPQAGIPKANRPEAEPGCSNVCMSCGAAVEQAHEKRIAGFLYRCPYCAARNFFFAK